MASKQVHRYLLRNRLQEEHRKRGHDTKEYLGETQSKMTSKQVHRYPLRNRLQEKHCKRGQDTKEYLGEIVLKRRKIQRRQTKDRLKLRKKAENTVKKSRKHIAKTPGKRSGLQQKHQQAEENEQKQFHLELVTINETLATETGVLDLTGTPRLYQALDSKDSRIKGYDDIDVIEVLNVKSVTTIVYIQGEYLKAFFTLNGKDCYSEVMIEGFGCDLAKFPNNWVAVTVFICPEIQIFDVSPELVEHSTISTSKYYKGISVLSQSTLVVTCYDPACVEIIDLSGNILKSFTSVSIQRIFKNPRRIHVTQDGNILVSEFFGNYVACMTQDWDLLFLYKIKKPETLVAMRTTDTGDILLLIIAEDRRVIHLTNKGKYVRDIFNSARTFDTIISLCASGDSLYVTTNNKIIKMYKVR